jgi:uncharacterized protein YcfJ
MALVNAIHRLTRITLALGFVIAITPASSAAQRVSSSAAAWQPVVPTFHYRDQELTDRSRSGKVFEPLDVTNPESTGRPNVLTGAALGALVGGVVGPIAGQLGGADVLAAAIIGGGAGAISGGIVVGLRFENVGEGAVIGFLPGFAIGALLGAASFPNSSAPLLWGIIFGIPTSAAGAAAAAWLRSKD